MKKTKILLTLAVSLCVINGLEAQPYWGTGSESTWTTGTLGVGTSITLASFPADAWQHIYGQPTMVPATCGLGGTPGSTVGYDKPELWIERQSDCGISMCWPVNPSPNFFQVGYSACGGMFPMGARLLDVINNQGWLGILTDHPSQPLDVNGNALIEKDLHVTKNAYVGGFEKITGNLEVDGGTIAYNPVSTGGFRALKGNNSNGALSMTGNTSSTDGGGIEMYGSTAVWGTDDRSGQIRYISNSNSGAPGYGHEFYNYSPATSWVKNVAITKDGRMIIGSDIMTPIPAGYDPIHPAGYNLYVSQGILTEKVKVAIAGTSNWSDFVFDDNYSLRSLSEVESYIAKNKHLPEVPSAKEVVTDGIDLATMDAKLLQKIEELTLYVIDLKKQNEKMQGEINAMKK